jgi:hypothetical protein
MKLSFAALLLLSVVLLSSFLRFTMAVPNHVASPPPPSPAIPSNQNHSPSCYTQHTHIYYIVLGFIYLLLQTNCRVIGLENVTGFCDPKCKARCAKAGYYQRCYDYCIICCKDCKCVPSGTYGNKSECPCYRDKLNSKGTSKCP